MSNSPSTILHRLRSEGHITEEECNKLNEAISVATASREPTRFIGISGGYDFDIFCETCGYKTSRFDLKDAKYCPMCGRSIWKRAYTV